MAITAAAIEANGWVLRVTHTRGLGAFASYTLDPNGTPRVSLSTAAPGFAPSAGVVVAASTARTIVATKPLRQAINPAANGSVINSADGTDTAILIDETDLGGGLTRVRLALSQTVYVTDGNLSLAVLAGWRSGDGAASGIAVTNGSTVAAPAPIVRWADVPYQLQAGSFDLEVVVASHHPNGLAPVAGVLFTVFDNATLKSFWATALATSVKYPAATADGTALPLRVYRVTVDPTTATALTRGLLRCDFKVFPWTGPARPSDATDTALGAVASSNTTPSMANLGTAGFATAAQVPFVVAYNPGGAWLTPRYAYVNAATGSTTAAASRVGTSAATASTTPLATINLAIESLRLHAAANPGVGTLAAANGQAAITQSVDGCRIRLVAGVTPGSGATSVATGVQTAATWLTIEGDPADANPRADCILRSPAAANGNGRLTRTRFTALSIEAQTNGVATTTNAWLDGVEVRGVAGQEATNGTPVPTTGVTFATAVKWWKHGSALVPSGSTLFPLLVRAVQVERSLSAGLIATCARLPTAVAGAIGVTGASVTSPASDAGLGLDRIAVGNDLRYLSGASGMVSHFLANAAAPANLTLGKTYNVASRAAWLNNVCESYGGSQVVWGSVGENTPCVATENIIEGNTFTGDRTNCWYNDLNLATIALNDSEDCLVRVNRLANNLLMRQASKQDNFNDGVVQAQRIGVALSTTRSKAYAVGAEIVIAGAPANVYHCTVAGTTAATGGPSGTGGSIADGTVTWAWFATEARQHGYRPQATGA